ncbi:MAG: Rrf2 family transcriptional regulator [Candidatus Dactylopiibacterium sp.]|nr:Rrf2 family transcriptional regulator [Candidatus Dactylopiibacterium sp.]
MKLTAFTDYTLRVLMYLALQPERLATIQQIATAYGISENHLMKVVHQLARSGTIESVRGKGGGIRLARPADQIGIGEVIRTAEGENAIVECFGDRESCCIAQRCKLAGVLAGAFGALYAHLDRYTLADLTGQPESLVQLLRLERKTPAASANADPA